MRTNDNGCRFYANPERTEYRWLHPLEQPIFQPGWIDCTDMTDTQFEAFVTGA